MAKLADVKGRSQNKLYEGAYYRCFGDIQLSRLLSRYSLSSLKTDMSWSAWSLNMEASTEF